MSKRLRDGVKKRKSIYIVPFTTHA